MRKMNALVRPTSSSEKVIFYIKKLYGNHTESKIWMFSLHSRGKNSVLKKFLDGHQFFTDF